MRIAPHHALDDRQLLLVPQTRRAQQHHPADQLRIPRRKLHRHLAPQTARYQMIRRRLHKLIQIQMQLPHQIVHINRLPRRDPTMQCLPLIRQDVRHMHVEIPRPKTAIPIPRLRLLRQPIDQYQRWTATVLPRTQSLQQPAQGRTHGQPPRPDDSTFPIFILPPSFPGHNTTPEGGRKGTPTHDLCRLLCTIVSASLGDGAHARKHLPCPESCLRQPPSRKPSHGSPSEQPPWTHPPGSCLSSPHPCQHLPRRTPQKTTPDTAKTPTTDEITRTSR